MRDGQAAFTWKRADTPGARVYHRRRRRAGRYGLVEQRRATAVHGLRTEADLTYNLGDWRIMCISCRSPVS